MSEEIVTGVRAVVPEGFFTRSQVGEKIGRSKDTIRRWHNTGVYRSEHQMKVGNITVWLYTDKDVDQMKKVTESFEPGKKYAVEEG